MAHPPSTCCSSVRPTRRNESHICDVTHISKSGNEPNWRNWLETFNINGNGRQRVAWMEFHKRRTPLLKDHVTRTPMSWPECMRPPAGRTLQARQRNVASAISQPTPRPTASKGIRLPPLNNVNQPRLPQKDVGRGSRYETQHNSTKKGNTGFSAVRWASERPTQVHATNVVKHNTNMATDNLQFKRAFPVPHQKRREKVVSLTEREAVSLTRLQSIYANTTERNLRAERIQKTMQSLQDKTLHTEVEESLHEYKRKAEIDRGNRTELKRVRDRYFKDKKRRNQNTHISLNALESPHVSRQAYGLPEEGEEFEETHLVEKTEQKLREIWKKAVRRAITIDKIINYDRRNTEPEVSIPKINIKRNSISKKIKRQESPEQSKRTSISSELMRIDTAMAEVDAVSSVGSDFDGELTDIGEED